MKTYQEIREQFITKCKEYKINPSNALQLEIDELKNELLKIDKSIGTSSEDNYYRNISNFREGYLIIAMFFMLIVALLLLSSCSSGIVLTKTEKPSTTIEVPSFVQYNGQTIQKVTTYQTPNEYEVTILTSKGKEKTYFVPTEIADTLQIGKNSNTFDLIR